MREGRLRTGLRIAVSTAIGLSLALTANYLALAQPQPRRPEHKFPRHKAGSRVRVDRSQRQAAARRPASLDRRSIAGLLGNSELALCRSPSAPRWRQIGPG